LARLGSGSFTPGFFLLCKNNVFSEEITMMNWASEQPWLPRMGHLNGGGSFGWCF
jgi:hypothetical protein